MKYLVLCVVLVGVSVGLSAAQEDVDAAILDIYGTGEDKTPQGMDEQNLVSCDCVPFYLCKNNTVNEYGENVIDIRRPEDQPDLHAAPDAGTPLGEECPHYMDKCCAVVDQTTPPPTPVPKSHSCGERHQDGVGFKVTGGSDNEANYGEFPWMVALLRNDHVGEGVDLKVMECGASLIHPQVVLTGAHCVKRKKDLYIRAGEWDTQTEKELYPTQERAVREIIIHEDYYSGGLHNDIALLVLESPVELSNVVDTICLPAADENMDGRQCVVSGWGKDVFGKEGKYQVILKRVDQPTVPREPCQAALRQTRLGPRFRLHKSFICAGGEVGKDSCKGDGGGPLVCPSKDNPAVYVQAGIVAWGIGCGTKNPSVYVNVPHFRNWIDNKIASLQLS